jgi:hypothetical protein
VLEKLLTVNLAVAKRVAPPPTLPDQVTVNEVFPLTKTVVCAAPGTAEATIKENTKTGIRSIFMNIRMFLLDSVQHDFASRQRVEYQFRETAFVWYWGTLSKITLQQFSTGAEPVACR